MLLQWLFAVICFFVSVMMIIVINVIAVVASAHNVMFYLGLFVCITHTFLGK